jgi:hypothetical protein
MKLRKPRLRRKSRRQSDPFCLASRQEDKKFYGLIEGGRKGVIMAIEYRKAIIHQKVGDRENDTEVLLPMFDDELEQEPVGFYGQVHLQYIREHNRPLFNELWFSGRLHDYLTDLDHEAYDMIDRLISQMKELEGVTEQLKVDDQMEWVRRMNNIHSRAEEVVNHELVFA